MSIILLQTFAFIFKQY